MKTAPGRWMLGVAHLLLPPACAGCGGALAPDEGRVCAGCGTRLRALPHPRCGRCSAPRGTGLPAERECPDCAEWPGGLVASVSAVVLAAPADTLVHGLKYGGWPELAPLLASRMERELPTLLERLGPDPLIVPVPTTERRERERGYNQAGLLADALHRSTGLVIARPLARREGGGTQVSLHRNERVRNVAEAFVPTAGCGAVVRGRAILLVDDVYTTGATSAAAAGVLLDSGAGRVGVLTFARSLPGSAVP